MGDATSEERAIYSAAIPPRASRPAHPCSLSVSPSRRRRVSSFGSQRFSFLGDKVVASLPPSPASASALPPPCPVPCNRLPAFEYKGKVSGLHPSLFAAALSSPPPFSRLRNMSGVACECAAATMPSDKVAARKGRLRQRYDNEYRLVAGCVPYRVKKDDEGNPCSSPGDDPAQVEVLMISTPNRADMVFPKGGWEDDEDVFQAACREAMEEAGVKGIINCSALGHWVFKSKSSQNSNSPRGACKGYIFAMEVTEELESWPEQSTHSRRWVSPVEAYQLCRYDWMREALTALLERLSVIEPVAAAAAAQELTDQAGMYMMLQATSDGAVALC